MKQLFGYCSFLPAPCVRYKQQIAEMEAAMKSTWEEKAKQSESSERERQRLQQQVRGSPRWSCYIVYQAARDTPTKAMILCGRRVTFLRSTFQEVRATRATEAALSSSVCPVFRDMRRLGIACCGVPK